MVVTLVLRQDTAWHSARIVTDPRLRQTLDLSTTITLGQHHALLTAARAASTGANLKVIIAAFEGSSILTQLSVVREFGFDVEVLVPVGARLYNRWTGKTRLSGMFEGTVH